MIPARIRNAAKICTRPELRQWLEKRKLRSIPRYTRCTTQLLGYELEVSDAASFQPMYDEIFEKEIYKFVSSTETPLIIDGGANIGLSVLYFKRLYPHAKVIAFEPDKNIYATLQKNIQNAGIADVRLENKALWSSDTILNFFSEGADSGRLLGEAETLQANPVDAVRLREFLNQRVEFLKLDIEGAETEVIQDCHDLLVNVQNIFVEYHSFTNRPQTLTTIIQILSDAGFRLYLNTPFSINPKPCYDRREYHDMDMVANIFGYRVQ